MEGGGKLDDPDGLAGGPAGQPDGVSEAPAGSCICSRMCSVSPRGRRGPHIYGGMVKWWNIQNPCLELAGYNTAYKFFGFVLVPIEGLRFHCPCASTRMLYQLDGYVDLGVCGDSLGHCRCRSRSHIGDIIVGISNSALEKGIRISELLDLFLLSHEEQSEERTISSQRLPVADWELVRHWSKV